VEPQVTVVTAASAPLWVFEEQASRAIVEVLAERGVSGRGRRTAARYPRGAR
jgi:hypothetical protein